MENQTIIKGALLSTYKVIYISGIVKLPNINA